MSIHRYASWFIAATLASNVGIDALADVPSGNPAQSGTLDEVVVTARKREEPLKDVPIAVSAVSTDTLQEQQYNEVRDVAQISPGLNITTDSPARAFISMRGIGDTLINSVQPGVGIFIDGIYQPNTAYLNSPLVDVARIEVLRGPQGTLFGNNTLGGAINVITNGPTNTWSGRVDGSFAGPDDSRSISASISGPIVSDVLLFRLGVAYHDDDGFARNVLIGGDANPLIQRSVTGTLVYIPSDWAKFTIKANDDHVYGGDTPYVDVTGPEDYSQNVTENARRLVFLEFTGVSAKGEFDIHPIDTRVTVIGAYNRNTQRGGGDGDYGPVNLYIGSYLNDLHTDTGELRFDTTWSPHVTSLIGLFWDESETVSTGSTFDVPLGLAFPSSGLTHLRNEAIYGTAFWQFRDGWDLAAGVRFDSQMLNASSAATAAAYKDNEVDPRVTLTRHWTPDFMTYASIARGSRGGGQNPPGSPNLIYKGDNVWTYELGTKLTALDHRLTTNADIFYNDYNNFIGPNAIAPSTSGVGFVTVDLNAGHVSSYGFEDEINWNITNAWNFHGSLTLLHARVTNDQEFIQVAGYALPGERIPFVPDWNFLLGSGYKVQLGGQDDILFNADEVAKGSRTGGSLNPNVDPLLKPYYLFNPSITYHHENLEVALFGTNVFNYRYLENYFDQSYLSRAGFTGNLVTSLSTPGNRGIYGVRFSMKY
jgi:iron complex outermembrane recepter protein